MVRAASQRAPDGEKDGLTADFALQLGVCGSIAGIAFFSIPALYMLVVLVVLLAASLTAVSSTARRDEDKP